MFGLLYNLFSGGIISAWHPTGRSFWASSWRFLLTFVAVQTVLVMLAALIVIACSATILSAPLVIGIVGGVVLQLLNSIGEVARGYAVVADRRNPFVVFGMAFALAARRLPAFLLLSIAGLALHAILLVFAWTLATVVPDSPLTMLWQQLLLAAAIGVKAIRLSWATALVQTVPDSYSSRNASAGDVRAIL